MRQVSVVIPNYNYEKYLERRLNSIINQTIKPAEILFLDDCSIDGSVVCAEKLLSKSDIPYYILKNKSNQGTFKQWISGIKLAKYDYIWIAEADDYCELNFLEIVMPKFEDEDVVLAYSESMQVDENMQKIKMESKVKENYFKLTRWASDFVNNGINEILNYLAFFNTIPNISAVVIRKSAIDQKKIKVIGEYVKAGDWLFYIIVLSQQDNYKLSYTAECLNYITRHALSASVNTDNGILLNQEVLQIVSYLLSNFTFNHEQKGYLFYTILTFMGWCTYSKKSQDLLFSLLPYFPDKILMDEICNVIKDRDNIISELKNLKKYEINSLNKESDNLKIELTILEEEINNLKKALDISKLESTILRVELSNSEKVLDTSKLELTILRKEINNLNNMIKLMQGSLSWRLTLPLRFCIVITRKIYQALTNIVGFK